MTIEQLLEFLDGNGLVITDWDLIIDALEDTDFDITDKIEPYIVRKPRTVFGLTI